MKHFLINVKPILISINNSKNERAVDVWKYQIVLLSRQTKEYSGSRKQYFHSKKKVRFYSVNLKVSSLMVWVHTVFHLKALNNYDLTEPGREIDTSCPRWKIQNGDFLPWTWSLVCVDTIQKKFQNRSVREGWKKIRKYTGDPNYYFKNL